MVTAEVALALPVLVLVMAAAMWGVRVTAAQLRCVDAAREAARVVARGDVAAAGRSAALAAAPPGAQVTIGVAARTVTVRVAARVAGFVPGLPATTVSATAATELEPALPFDPAGTAGTADTAPRRGHAGRGPP
jgi:hypothetical protein